MTYDVFISFKNSDGQENKTKDYAIAKDLYEFLKSKGVSVFFSPSELERLGQTDYSKAIDDALEQSSFLIAVGCSEKNLNSRWVRYEWSSFSNEIKSGRKSGAEVFVVFSDMKINELPFSLRQQQAFNVNESDSFEKLFNFMSARLEPPPPPPKPQVFCPFCRAPNVCDAKFCENCGTLMIPEKKPFIMKVIAIILTSIALLVAVFFGIRFMGENEVSEANGEVVATPTYASMSTIETVDELAYESEVEYIYIRGGRFSVLQDKLDLSGMSLQDEDIASLRYMTNLIELNLYENQINDLTVLAYLTNLEHLILSGNQINDLTPLSNLTNLYSLFLNRNQISDLSPLQNLTKLEDLRLWQNYISDITPLSNLLNLGYLGLSENQINNLLPLSNLTRLYDLGLNLNYISDLTPLSNLVNLEILRLNTNQIGDLTPLSNLASLKMLRLNNNQIGDLTPLSNLVNLRELGLSRNQIIELTVLSNLSNLNELWLSDNQISDLMPLSSLTNLESLNLSNNQIADLTPLFNLANLESLNLANNQNSDLSQLPNLTLSGTAISTRTTIANVNIRTGPSIEHAIIAVFPGNTSIEILEYKSNGWSRVRYDGTVGFIRTDLASR